LTAKVGGVSASADGKISGPATVTFNDQSSSGTTVTVSSVYLPAGGFVAIHEGDAGGPVIGTSTFLTSGTHEDVEVTLDEPYEDAQTVTLVAMPHQDTNNNKTYEFPGDDGPYTENGSAVTDSASATIERGTPTPRVVTVEQPSPTPRVVTETRVVTVTVDDEETTPVTEMTETQGQPGFGIAVAVVALLAAALLAVRRRD
jgi:PGF-CTERM protein